MQTASGAVVVRTARPDDGSALVAVDSLTWTTGTSPAPAPDPPRPFFGDGRRESADVLVAEVAGVVVGYAGLANRPAIPSHAHVWEIDGLAVHPDSRGRGVGRALVEAAVAEAVHRGARKVSLRVLGHNDRARRLYTRCGFGVEGVLRAEFVLDGRPVDDVLMARHLR